MTAGILALLIGALAWVPARETIPTLQAVAETGPTGPDSPGTPGALGDPDQAGGSR